MTRQRIGLIGGTFDPVHIGHLVIADRAREQLHLDRIIFLPAGIPPHKQQGHHAHAAHRLAMLELALAGHANAAVSDRDIRPGRPSFTLDLLRDFDRDYPDADLFFIIGGDSLRDFPTWHEPDAIIRLATLAVANRPGAEVPDDVFLQVQGLKQAVAYVDSPLLDISATDLRNRVAAGLSIDHLVPARVIDYIAEHRLYTDNG
jgi:nicotinate-nucleotide adenylyltransferase